MPCSCQQAIDRPCVQATPHRREFDWQLLLPNGAANLPAALRQGLPASPVLPRSAPMVQRIPLSLAIPLVKALPCLAKQPSIFDHSWS